MTLGAKQRLFARLETRLQQEILARGYEFTFGDAKATTGHMPGSLHYSQLAVDLNLFRDGVYLTKTEDHLQFGVFWEAQHPLCRWGGRFKGPKGPDGNHYSLEHEGRA